MLLGEGVNVDVRGEIRTQGSIDDPVVFNSISREQPWGGVEIDDGSGELEYTFFTNGGADTSRQSGPLQQPTGDPNQQGTLDVSNCFVLNTVGKAFRSVDARVNLDQVVISNVDTGGEFSSIASCM